jgi:hypothetical protein
LLFSPDAHEPLTGTPWSAERARAAIAAIAVDAEQAFDDGWLLHPLDEDGWAPAKPRTLYLGGSGVVAALERLGSDCNWAPYLEACLEAEEDSDRSLWGARRASGSCCNGSLRRRRI